MHQVTIHEAKTHLSRLIKEALSGEEVIIAKGHTALVRIQPIPVSRLVRRIGGAAGIVRSMAPDFTDPLDDFAEYMK